ncbi:MAG: L-2-hydroxyglutarate oxidase [Acidimicrobiales bacterium]|jgi:L-2-hydroxyglutarate oxidase|nr:L-2-hydroxyglutarate oxidase [Acidimicrobiales bacterium]HCK75002.1 L-2-hydroxyglutarate oxidase [Acidimicrobiaceae bacterium]|tara:strand:- start:1111 stop:2316 length:1206 start_codon:yes stop_codon:yes gene_type:complete
MSSEPVDLAIVGAGIIGLATAHRYIAKHPGQSVLILERESGFAHHQTGRNSGVLHSGIYYAPGSMKAELAVAGRSAMVDFCRERGIDHEVCGKVIVATRDDEIERLRALSGRAELNGLSAELIDAGRLTEIEPHCNGIEALYVPSTGIVSYSKVCEALRIEIEESGGSVRFDTSVLNVEESEVGARISTSGGEIFARFLVNCAGLRCDQVAGMVNAAEGNRIVPFRGEYYELVPERSHLVKGLIYPVPDPSFPFLGVHLTRMIDGSIHAGPNAVLALSREGYRWRDVQPSQILEHVTNRGLWKLARKYWRTGAGEVWRSLNKAAFVRALQRLVPEIESKDLEASPAGVRAQAMDANGELLDDFAITRSGNSLHVINAPSPAATASLEIGGRIVEMIEERES